MASDLPFTRDEYLARLETLRRAMEIFSCDFFQGFGQTEASPVITQVPAPTAIRTASI